MKEESKLPAIISYFTIIGWVIGLLLNNGDKKSEFNNFHIRQSFGIILLGLIFSFIPGVNIFLGLIMMVFWIIAFIRCVQGDTRPIPLIGEFFQNMFKDFIK